MLNFLPVSVLVDICRYLHPCDLTNLLQVSKQLLQLLNTELFWGLRYTNKFGLMGVDSEITNKQKYRQKYIENKEKIFKQELQGYSCSSNSSGKILNLSSLFGEINDFERNRQIRKSRNGNRFKIKNSGLLFPAPESGEK